MEQEAVTANYGANVHQVIGVLNAALATEIVCVLRHRRHYQMARGMNSEPVKAEFQERVLEEQAHADRISARIVQLGGEPNLSPGGLASRSHSQYVEGGSRREMTEEDLVAERIAIETYREMAQRLAGKDATTRRMIEEILASEELHAYDLPSLLSGEEG